MQLDLSVPKKNAVSVADGEDGLLLCSAREGMERALSAAAGRALVLADGSSFSSFIPASRAANTVCMLWGACSFRAAGMRWRERAFLRRCDAFPAPYLPRTPLWTASFLPVPA